MEPRRLQPGAEGRLQPFRRDAPPAPYPGPDDPGYQLQGGLRRVRMVSWTWAASCPAGTTPEGHSPATGHWDQKAAVPPASIREATGRIFSGSGMAQPRRRAHWSKAKIPRASVAVVRTACPPSSPAISRARVVGAPRWPERMGTATAPARPPPPRRGPGPYSPDGGPPTGPRSRLPPQRSGPPRGGRRRRSTPPPARPSGYRRRGAAPLQAGRQRGGQPPTILCKGNKLHSHWDASR